MFEGYLGADSVKTLILSFKIPPLTFINKTSARNVVPSKTFYLGEAAETREIVLGTELQNHWVIGCLQYNPPSPYIGEGLLPTGLTRLAYSRTALGVWQNTNQAITSFALLLIL